MSLPVLYSFRRCPYAIRARMAIVVSGFICELREVSLKHKPDALRIASPKATVPVMVLPNGGVIDQSLDIMAHALAFRDPMNWNDERAETLRYLVEVNDTIFKKHLDGYKYPDRTPDEGLFHRAAATAILGDLESNLVGKCHLAGPVLTWVDVAIFPFVRQFAAVDEAYFASLDMPHLQAWLRNFLDSALFAQVMTSYPVWQEGQGVTIFPS
jgi:glutathione S-transferase